MTYFLQFFITSSETGTISHKQGHRDKIRKNGTVPVKPGQLECLHFKAFQSMDRNCYQKNISREFLQKGEVETFSYGLLIAEFI